MLQQVNKLFFLGILFLLSSIPAIAQDSLKTVFFIAPMADISFFGRHGISAGGGFMLGSDNTVSIGISGIYIIAPGMKDEDRIDMVEINVLLRIYLLNKNPEGLFIQANVGGAIYAFAGEMSAPADAGSLSLGITAGWRFPFKKYFYVEPSLRLGYPYIIGLTAACGFRL